jgi:hypothetical protein
MIKIRIIHHGIDSAPIQLDSHFGVFLAIIIGTNSLDLRSPKEVSIFATPPLTVSVVTL